MPRGILNVRAFEGGTVCRVAALFPRAPESSGLVARPLSHRADCPHEDDRRRLRELRFALNLNHRFATALMSLLSDKYILPTSKLLVKVKALIELEILLCGQVVLCFNVVP